jgi:serine O-acetyltransferase
MKGSDSMKNIIESEVNGILATILEDYKDDRAVNKMDIYNQPDKTEIINILENLFTIVYPGFYRDKSRKIYNIDHTVSTKIEDVMYHLNKQIMIVLKYTREFGEDEQDRLEEVSQKACVDFMKTIPKVREYLETDLDAAYDGDPAARSRDEVLFSYPGIFAITVYRLAHELFLLGIPLIPRMMTEEAHSRTGIDIHPGATIGKYFFIDHGTGIVVGETTIIGEHVKLYQGVTLGALSTRGGQTLKNLKRHPTIEDNVTIYSGASILGGNTVIGHDSVIGGNVFITKSVPANTRVSVKNQELISRTTTGKGLQRQELTQNDVWYYVI